MTCSKLKSLLRGFYYNDFIENACGLIKWDIITWVFSVN